MKNLFLTIIMILMVFVTSSFGGGLTPDEIINRANRASLYQGDDIKGRLSIKITDKLGRKRSRVLNMMRKNSPDNDDQKYFVLFLRPVDVKKMVFMVFKHDDLEKDDDRWLYMPGLDLVKRIAASDKRTSFAGSDFLYEDISGRSPKEDNHFLIKETEDFYLIKGIPKDSDSVEFEHYRAYIDKENFIPLKVEYYKKNDRLYRTIEARNIEKIKAVKDGKSITYPTVTLSVAKDLESGSESIMKLGKIKYNSGIKDKYFSERFLRRPPGILLR